ncbi:MAG TPA: aminoglycoside phosphotransferase family protein [Nocardioidaceae bacterium]|nr:aminoglycoside phosphotransferase family protein [Nocardioidaceae bacterium]
MPTSLLFDDPSAVRLAGLDPVLSLLPDALPQAATGPTWELHDVRWTPGVSCRLAYRVRMSTSSRFVAVNLTGQGSTQHDYREDPMLPGLTSASDATAVEALVAELFDGPVLRVGVEPVRYRPGSRCVLRYDVETAAGPHRLYAKAFRPERFAEVARLGSTLAGAAEGLRLVPELAAVWPGLHVMVGAGIHGRTVSAVLGDPGVPAGRRARLAHSLGDLLARFHEQHLADAPRRSATEQLTELTVATAAARSADARLADRLDAVLDLLAARVPAAGVDVFGHGGFRAGQVLLSDDGRLTVLDTDGVCVCDAGRDLGTVLAHLTWQGVRLPNERPVLRGAAHALLSGYENRAGAVEPEALQWWRAVGLLQVVARRYRRLEIQHWSDVPALMDAAADVLATPQLRSAPGGATDLLDIRQMSKVLRVALARSAGSPPSVEIVSASLLATAPGRRTVVRYSVRGPDGVQAVPLIGKALTESRRARLLHEHLRLLYDGPFGAGDLRVPEPVALLPAQRLVLFRECEGTPLDQITEPADFEAGVRRAARWLARLHMSDVVLPRTFSLAQEGESTRQWAGTVGQVHPALAAPARALAEGWATVAMSADLVKEVPIHKDFHPGHVLVGDDLCVVDLDEARRGDPAFDVAHFCCYLELGGGYGGSSGTAAFLDEYAVATGWTDKGTYDPFCAYTWLKIAKQRTLGRGPCRATATARRAAEVERALVKGAECLRR